jgi:hypothetical protein
VVGCWIFFFFLKGHHLGFCKNCFAATLRQIIGKCKKIGEALKMVCSADQFVKHGISANSSGAR